MTRRSDESLQRMVLIPEAAYKSMCEKKPSAEEAAPVTEVLDGPRDVLGKNLVGMQQRLHELDSTAPHPPNAVHQLQRSQLESRLLHARRAFLQPPAQPTGPPAEVVEASERASNSLDDGGVPKALRARFQRLAERVFPESGAEAIPATDELTQQEVQNLMEYVVRDKPLKRHASRAPGGLQNFLDFLRKRDVDPNLVGKHLRSELRDGGRPNREEAVDEEGSGEKFVKHADMQMLEDYESMS